MPIHPLAARGSARIVQVSASAGAITMGVLLTAALFAILHGLLQIGTRVEIGERPAMQVDLVSKHAANAPEAGPTPPVTIDVEHGVSGGKRTERKTPSEISRASHNRTHDTPLRKSAPAEPVPASETGRETSVEQPAAQVEKRPSRLLTDSPPPTLASESPGQSAVAETRPEPVRMTVMHRPAPRYPSRARRRGIEGEVTVGFTVTSTGSVEGVRIIEANPKGYFENAAIEAARRFRFAPATIAGDPIAVADVRNRFSFRLQN